MHKHKNHDLTKAQISKTLRYSVGVLRATRTDHDFFKILVTKIIPLIRQLYPDLIRELEREIVAAEERYKQLQLKIYHERDAAAEALKARLEQGQLLDIPIIKRCFDTPAHTHSSLSKEEILSAPFIKTCFDFCDSYIKTTLCFDVVLNELLKLGHVDIVKDYAEVTYFDGYRPRTPEESGSLIPVYSCTNFCGYQYNDKSAEKDSNGKQLQFENLDPEWSCPKCNCKQESLNTSEHNCRDHFIAHEVPCKIPRIERFTFMPSSIERSELYHRYDLNNVTEPWVAWYYITRVEWGSKDRSDYFKKKKLLYESIQASYKVGKSRNPTFEVFFEACQRDGILLGEHMHRSEWLAIQNKKQGSTIVTSSEDGTLHLKQTKKVHLFERDRINKYLTLILSKITGQPTLETINSLIPHAIELVLYDEIHLRLMIQWEENVFEEFHLHSFQEGLNVNLNGKRVCIPNVAYNFISELIRNSGIFVKILVETDGKYAVDYLRQAGIYGVLKKIFITQLTKDGAKLKATRILLAKESEAILKKLLLHIQKLKFISMQVTH